MTLETFEARRFQAKTAAMIDHSNSIIAEYQALGFVLTLRQLYYQFVARAAIANTLAEYKRLGTIIRSGRRAGLIDWDAIEDRTRNVRRQPSWSNPSEIIEAVSGQYREDLWAGQHFRPEVWIEKDALLGVIENVCEEYRVPYFACRGNNSESEQYKAGKRFAEYLESGLTPIVLHLGDHDPNGLDMTRDNRDRLALFARGDVEVRRIALNMDQVELSVRRRIPLRRPTPAMRPTRGSSGRVLGARRSRPTVIAELIRAELAGLIDPDLWNAAKAEEAPTGPFSRRHRETGPWSRTSLRAANERASNAKPGPELARKKPGGSIVFRRAHP